MCFFFSRLSSCCHRWKHFGTESVPSCSPDNVHSTIPQEVIVDPGIAAERARMRRVMGLPGDQQPKLLPSLSNYGDSRIESGIEKNKVSGRA